MSTAALACALAAAASWAVASISLSRVLERGAVSPAAANLFKNGVAASFFLVLALAGGGRWPVGDAWLWLFASGLLGFAVSDTLYFAAFRRCGVQTAATVMLLNVPIATVLSVPMVGDALDGRLLALMAIVLGGVLIVTLDGSGVEDPEGHRIPPRTRAIGVLLAVGAATAIGTAVPLGRGRFEGVDVFTGGFVRLLGGAAGAIPLALLAGLGRSSSPGRELRRLVEPLLVAPGPASVWGRASLVGVSCAVLGLLPYHYAMRELPGGLAAVLFSSTPLFTLPLCLLIGQRAGPLAILGTGVGFAGVAAILLGGAGGAPVALRLEVTPAPLAGPTSARFPMFVRGSDALGLPPALVTARAAGGAGGAGPSRLVLLGDRSASVPSERTVTAEVEGGPAGDRRFFVNWADVPQAARMGSGALLAASLERLGDSTYAYGVRLTLEEDGAPGRDLGWLHDDDSPVEHGFVSMVPLRTGEVLCVWLDGRAGGEGGGHGHGGAMQLRARTVGAGGVLGEEALLDERVCDCCPTAAVELGDGSVVVVYRDRSEGELRDVWTVRRDPEGSWSEPRPVFRDGWRIEGCPVNGPAVAAADGALATAWYTEGGRDATPRVQVAFSRDGGRSFSRPEVVEADGALGRVALAPAGGGRFVVAYLAAPSDGAPAWLGRLVSPGRAFGPPVLIDAVDPGRRSGRLSLASAPREGEPAARTMHAIWTVEDGVQAATLGLVGDEPESP